MTPLTVYSQPGCQPCKGVYRALDKAEVSYEAIDISTDHEARSYIASLGYTNTPVIVAADGTHWSGYSKTVDYIRSTA